MGTSFGRYKVAEELGRGAMGVVYRAVDPAIGRSIAIKAINTAYLESLGVKPEEYSERFQREAQVAGALNHPHIVKIFDLGADYLVMEYVEGQTLAELLRAQGRLPRETALRVLGEAASALDHAHAAGVVHRDIKPANVMVQPNGAVKVMDFGLARIESSTLTAAGEVLGSAAYMAPEVVLGHPAVARSDIFSLAVVAYELLTGTRPFAGPTVSAVIQSVVRTPPRPARELDATLSPETDGVFARALAKEPAQRYDSAGEFVRALAMALWAQSGPEATAVSAPTAAETIIMAPPSAVLPEPPAATLLGVNADELGQPGDAADPMADTTRRVVPATGPAAPAGVPAEARAADAASSDEGTAATVILPAPVSANGEPAGEDSPATVTLLKQPALPTPPETTRPALQPSVDAGDAAATVIMKTPGGGPKDDRPKHETTASRPAGSGAGPADQTVVVRATSASRGVRPAEPEAPPAAAESAPPQPPADRAAPAPPESLATVRMTADDVQAATAQAARAREAASASPATVRLPPPPAPATPLPPATPTVAMPAVPPATSPAPPASTGAAPPSAAPALPGVPPAAPRAGARSALFAVGVVGVILLLFGAAVAGFFWLVRSRTAPETAASPSPAAEAATAPSPPGDESGAAAAPTPEPDTADAAAPEPVAPATLFVVSDPEGAAVTIGRRPRGRTPLRLSLPAGSLTVEVQKNGYKPWSESARLRPGQTHRLHAQLEPLAPPKTAAPSKPAAQPAVREGDLVELGPDVTPPRKLSGGTPTLPRDVRRNLSGSAVVEFTVEIDGSVSSPRIVESLGKIVDRAVLEVIQTWRYEPARKDGVRVRVVQRAKFTYVRG